jgi:sec-independent protein translocase protein TatC
MVQLRPLVVHARHRAALLDQKQVISVHHYITSPLGDWNRGKSADSALFSVREKVKSVTLTSPVSGANHFPASYPTSARGLSATVPRSLQDSSTFIEHLEELRERIIKSLLAFALAVVVGYFVAPWPLQWLTLPILRAYDQFAQAEQKAPAFEIEVGDDGVLKLRNAGSLQQMQHASAIDFYTTASATPVASWQARRTTPLLYLRPMDPFVIRLKAAVFVGILLYLPIWAFISPGLLRNEKRFAIPLIIAGSLLFPIGAAFAYFLLDVTLRFFTQFVTEYAVPFNDARAYLGFVITMMLAFGLIFELPLFVVLAVRAGLVEVQWLADRRKYIFIGLLVAAAAITPSGDPATLLALTAPLYLLFEAALIVSRFLERKDAQELSDEDSEAPAP